MRQDIAKSLAKAYIIIIVPLFYAYSFSSTLSLIFLYYAQLLCNLSTFWCVLSQLLMYTLYLYMYTCILFYFIVHMQGCTALCTWTSIKGRE